MTQLSFAAFYCHVHQAWCYSAAVHRQTGEDVIGTLHSEFVSLGPFDGTDALLVIVADLLARAEQALLAFDGRPTLGR